jgi:hypothetical protein
MVDHKLHQLKRLALVTWIHFVYSECFVCVVSSLLKLGPNL